MKIRQNKVASLAATLITFVSLAGGANGAIIINISEIVGGVSVHVTGSLDTTGATQSQTSNSFGNATGYSSDLAEVGIFRGNGAVGTSYQTFFSTDLGDLFPGGLPQTAVSTGDFFGPFGLLPSELAVPVGYVSGTFIDATAEYSGVYFGAGLLSDGFTRTSTLVGGSGDTLTVTASAVPEPSSALLLGLGALGLVSRRKRSA